MNPFECPKLCSKLNNYPQNKTRINFLKFLVTKKREAQNRVFDGASATYKRLTPYGSWRMFKNRQLPEPELSNYLSFVDDPWLMNLNTHTHTHTQSQICRTLNTAEVWTGRGGSRSNFGIRSLNALPSDKYDSTLPQKRDHKTYP